MPKPLLELEGKTFLDRMIDAVAPSCAPVIVVLGYEAERIRQGIRLGEQVTFVVNPNPEQGQLSSLQWGLRRLPQDAEGVLFSPVDYPRVSAGLVAQLVSAYRQRPAGTVVVLPACRGQHGHPVCIAPELVGELLALPVSAQARDVIRRYRDRTLVVETGDPAVLQDVDDPGMLRQLLDGSRE